MKKSIILLFVSIILLFLLTCDIYNKSIPDYLETYTNSASVAEHIFTDGTLINPQSQVYSGLIKPDSVIDLKLRNPKNFELLTYLDYSIGGGKWEEFTRTEAPDYKNVEFTASPFSGTIEVKHELKDLIRISIKNAAIGEDYNLRLRIKERETKRDFESYILPKLTCTDYPEEIRNLSIAAGSEGNGLRVKWGQNLRNSGVGDRADANNLVISCTSLGVPETYTRTFDGTSWSDWSRDVVKISRMGDDYSVIIGSHVPLINGALYNVNLRFKNEAGVVREISKSLTGDPYCVRVTIGDSHTLYTTLDKAFEYIDEQNATAAIVTILNDIDDQKPIEIPGSGAGSNITLLSEGANTIQLGQKGALFEVLAGGSLKIGGTTSGTVILRGINDNDTALVYARGTLEINANTIIRDNTNYGNGGGVYVHGGTVTMNGGFIENNIAINPGSNGWSGGVELYSGTFTMNGGTIRNNQAVMGGGLYVWSGGTLNMKGGTIENNTASSNGGGVYVSGGTFNMEGSARVTPSGDNTVGKNDISASRIYITNNFSPTGTGDIARITPQNYGLNDLILDEIGGSSLAGNYPKFVITPENSTTYWSINQNGRLQRINSNVDITVTAPQTGNAPSDAATGTGNFSIGLVSWSPTATLFQGNSTYTATVSLNASQYHTFTGLSSVTINGFAATVISNTGSTLTISRAFQTGAAAVKSIAVTTQPTNMGYYTHGDSLNLAGIVVTITYNDDSTEPVALSEFAANSITTTPANGTTLSRTTHDAMGITVSLGAANTTTSNLNIERATPIVTTWPTALAPATFGDTLADVSYTGGSASVPGTFAWITTGTPVGPVGTQPHGIRFTPTAVIDYNTVDGTINVVVEPAAPAGTWPQGLSATYGQTLSDVLPVLTTFNELDGIPGEFTWTTPTNSVGGNVGSISHSMTFTPTDTANYSVVSANVSITVNPKPLTITGVNATPRNYNATNIVALTGGTLQGGIIGTDVVTPVLNNGTMADANVGTGKAVTTNITLTGAQAARYTLTSQPSGITVDIAAINLTITGVGAPNRQYDGTTNVTLSGGSLVGVLGTDVVTPVLNNGTMADANVGTGKDVTTNITLTGAQAGNYTLTQPNGITITITQKVITITGVTATNRVYDRMTDVNLAGGTLQGVVAPDVVSFTLGSGTMADVNVGTGKTVTTNIALSGAGMGNYTLTQPTVTVNITAKALTITGVQATNRAYNNTLTVELTGGTLGGVEVGDTVTHTPGNGTVTTAAVGTGKAVTASITLGGANAANYTLTQPTGITVNITAKALTITGVLATNRAYNNTTTVVLTGGTLVGVEAGDTVTFTRGDGTIPNVNVQNGKAVTTSITLGGADMGNYTLTQPTGITVNITAATIVIGVSASRSTFTPLSNETTATLTYYFTGLITGDGATMGAVTCDTVLPGGLTYNSGTGVLTYNGTTAFATPSLTLNFSAAAPTSNYNAAFGSMGINVYDGQADYNGTGSDRRIPVTTSNFTAFGNYARVAPGLSRHYKLTGTTTAPSPAWTKIGAFGAPFTGTFDGMGFTINGLFISNNDEHQGFFGFISATAIIRNVGLTGVNIGTGYWGGGIAGLNDGGIIRNCFVTGMIVSSGLEVGGIVGRNTSGGLVESCYTTCTVSGEESVGGIVGNNAGGSTIRNSYSTGNISGAGSSPRYIGGVVGDNSGNIGNCYATGSISGTANIGGVVGYIYSGTVQNCVALNTSVSAASIPGGRVAGQNSGGSMSNNKARSNMTISGFSDTPNGANTPNGESVSPTTAKSTVFSGWDTGVWTIPAGDLTTGTLPTLQNMPTGTQNPVMQ